MDPQAFVVATLAAHVGFAIFVTAHASLTDREVGKWPFVTLAFGLAGIAAYFFYDGSSDAGRI
ncbi:hypothetical protein BDK88_0502 [Natrinema hispanicum]|uniref:Uncharacterized protein n=1 Tax=Natrinema hispanicum TaxID=392421 RepID=A0A482YI80_9EURY|nr:hypothetical protein [Natrinema hispanicum]RZV11622.1 hypothetical protein BDK88_0502 [Natrinema hispanicum]